MSAKYTKEYLAELQGYPLSTKVALTKQRIREWVNRYGEDGVYVSFSGGKDSTVLLHLVREMYGDSIPGVFVDTGLEFPEIRQFVRNFDNIVWLKPKKNFRKVIEEYGYPFISKEVSECVYAARKYLTEVLQELGSDRQTDRQTDRRHKWHYQKYRQLCGLGEYAKPDTRGGDAKYRKLRGLSEYSQKGPREEVNIQTSKNARDADNEQRVSDSGEYP